MRGLAAELHGEMTELATITRRTRGDCPRMASELRPLVIRMQATAERVAQAKADPALAKELTTELRTYDAQLAGVTDAISADLLTCKDSPEVFEVVQAIPVH